MLHHFLSGGEECTNNVGYFVPAGLTWSGGYTSISIVGSPVGTFAKPFFNLNAYQDGGFLSVKANQADTNFFYGLLLYNQSRSG
jgi:hypothetical protein